MPTISDITLDGQAAINRLTRRYRQRRASQRLGLEPMATASGRRTVDALLGVIAAMCLFFFVVG